MPPADEAPRTDACTPPDAPEPVRCPGDRPRCDVNGLFGQPFACLACLQGSDCNGPAGTVCRDGECPPAERSCAAGCDGDVPHCDESRNVCVACLDASHCPPARNICDEEGAQGRVLACVACLSSADCSDPTAARCAAGLCDTCNADADCAHLSATPRCEATSRRCVECTPDTEATECADDRFEFGPKHTTCIDFACSETQPGSRRTCQSCNADNECEAGYFCVPMTFRATTSDPFVPVGNFCLRLETEDDECEPTDEAPFGFPRAGLTALGGTSGTFCGPQSTTTCPGVLSYQSSCCPVPRAADGSCVLPGNPNDINLSQAFNECGMSDQVDALCLRLSGSTYRCSPRCSDDVTCSDDSGTRGGECDTTLVGVGKYCTFEP